MTQVYQIRWDSNDARFDIGEGMIITNLHEWETKVTDYVTTHLNKFQKAYNEDNEFGEFPSIQHWVKWCIFNFLYPIEITIDDYDKNFA